MTANQVKGKSFRGALRYNLEKVEKGVAQVLGSSFVSTAERAIMEEVRMVRMQRPNLAKYFYHTSLNFPPGEDLADDKMMAIARDYLAQNGFNQHQHIIFRHRDADHPHLHILVNRIGYDGNVVSDSWDYARSERVARNLEKAYGLTQVISSQEAKERAMTKNELEMMKRTNAPSAKMQLQVMLKDILARRPTVEQFINTVEAHGINVLFNQARTGYVSGISYGYQGAVFKGASLGNAYKWSNVKNTIGYEQERDCTTIYEANVRTRAAQAGGGLGRGAGAYPRHQDATHGHAGELSKEFSKRPARSGAGVQGAGSGVGKGKGEDYRYGFVSRSSRSEYKDTSATPSLADLLAGGGGGVLRSVADVGNGNVEVGLGLYRLKRRRKSKKIIGR